MTAGSVFDQDASRKLEATYQTPDVIAQRAATPSMRSPFKPARASWTLAQAPDCWPPRWPHRSGRMAESSGWTSATACSP
jgi:hypothetical protein